jgi:GntR family transcriptional regulator
VTILNIHASSPLPIFAQIMHGMKELILHGNLKAGEMIPSVRALAQDLKVNPNTVARAYRDLEREKWIEAQRGEGYRVLAPPGPGVKAFIKEKQKGLSNEILSLKKAGLTDREILETVKAILEGSHD